MAYARLCHGPGHATLPDAIRVPPRHGIYSKHSRAVMALLSEYTPIVEQISIDEAFLDLTGTEALRSCPRVARLIQQRAGGGRVTVPSACNQQTGGQDSLRAGKPRGLIVVPPGEEAAYLAPLSIRPSGASGRPQEID